MKQYLEIGKLTKTQGLNGEMRMQFYCDSADVLGDMETLYFDKGKTPVKLISVRYVKNDVCVVKLGCADTVEDAQKYLGKTLYADRADFDLPEGVYFIDDLIGLDVIDADNGKSYGKIDEVLQNGPTDVYSLKTPDGRQLMFPSIPEVVINRDIEGGKIVIRPLDGLFEDGDENNVEKED